MPDQDLLLKISNDVARLDERTINIQESQDKLVQKLDKLPCSTNSQRIKALEDCQSKVRETATERIKGNYSVIVAILALLGTITLALVQLLG